MKLHFLPRLLALFVVLACTSPAWSQNIVSCNSDDMGYHTCNIGPNRGVTLYRQHSDAQCIQGQTYGVRGQQLWVNRGCRAEFQVNTSGGGRRGWNNGHNNYGNNGYGNGGYGGSARTVTCSSDDMHRHTCDVGPNGGIRLIRQRSDARCDFNRTYGFNRNQIWVDRGCRADFEVSPQGHRR